jgi:hypothetical protein
MPGRLVMVELEVMEELPFVIHSQLQVVPILPLMIRQISDCRMQEELF